MNPTKNDLPLETRTTVCSVLNTALAHLIHLQLSAKQAHWNVKGPQFIALHELFDDVYASLGAPIDDTAERIVALGGVAEGTLDAVQAKSKLKSSPLGITAGRDHLDALSGQFAMVGKTIRESIDSAAQAGDQGSADLLTGISRELDKQLWFIESHLQG